MSVIMGIASGARSLVEEREVREANNIFYQAMQSLDLARMENAWWHEDWVLCLHPGWGLIIGWDKIKESWNSIFRSTVQLQVSITEPRVCVVGDAAWVSCTEQVTSMMETDFTTARVEATNIFVRRKGRWRMVHHHTTPLPDRVISGMTHSVQ
jgi:ketosteroid isomerase-like protein